jgi:protein-glutamine gamma-glutamyltransferase
MGVPARVVTGFQSGTYNPLTGWHVIRASDAHSWVEAYLDHRGWTTFDPTPADTRVEAATLWSRLAMLADAADTFWREWVLNYDRERQISLAVQIDSSSRALRFDWVAELKASLQRTGERIANAAREFGLALFIVITAGIAALFTLPRLRGWFDARHQSRRLARGHVQPHDATVLYNRMLAILRRRGFEKPPWLTPAEFARVLPAAPEGILAEEITAAYNELRYGAHAGAARRMVDLIAELEAAR